MNAYAKQMRDVVQRFAGEAKALEAKKKQNSETYLPDVAASENEKIDERRKDMLYRAMDTLDEIERKARADAFLFGKLDGAKISDDIKLLQSGIKLNTADINGLIEKHRDNGTMLRAIEDYATENKIPRNFIPSAASKEKAWGTIANTGRTLLQTIDHTPEGGPMQDKAIEVWLDDNAGGTYSEDIADILR